jgi:BON domain
MPATSGGPAKLAGECLVTAEDRVRTRAFRAGGAGRSRSQRHAGLDAEELGVSSENGIVTLTGTVRSWAGRATLPWPLRGAPGVTDVRDRRTFSY